MPLYAKNPVGYTFHWNGSGPFWTNAEDGSAKLDEGLSLIAGNIHSLERNGIRYVYTATRDPVVLEQYVQVLWPEMQRMADEIGLPIAELKQVVAVPIEKESLAGFFFTSRLAGATLYLTNGTTPYLPMDGAANQEYYLLFGLESIVGLLLDEPEFLYQTDAMQRSFVNAYLVNDHPENAKYVEDDKVVAFVQGLDEPAPFFRAWYEAMKTTPNLSREALYLLMDEWGN